jgi:hypothetical protein
MAESPILDRIDSLVEEEHRLRAESEQGRLDEEGHRRLEAIESELDPDAKDLHPDVPFPPNDLEGPEPEPPHLEHGVHDDQPAPDPDVPRDIP